MGVLDAVGESLSHTHGVTVTVNGADKPGPDVPRRLPATFDAPLWFKGAGETWLRKTFRHLVRNVQRWELRGYNSPDRYYDIGKLAGRFPLGVPENEQVVDAINGLRVKLVNPAYEDAVRAIRGHPAGGRTASPTAPFSAHTYPNNICIT